MEKKITKKAIDFFSMEAAIKAVTDAPGFKFQILLAKNEKVLKSELEIIREKSKACEEFEEAQKGAEEIRKKFSDKNDDGTPKIITEMNNGRPIQKYDIPESKLEELKTEFEKYWDEDLTKEAREKQQKIYEDYNTYITTEDLTLNLFTIPMECVPEEYFAKEEHKDKLKEFVNACFELIEE